MLSIALFLGPFDSSAAAIHANFEPLASLGHRRFFDTRLSADQKVSCATCHQPERAFLG
jgi:cytochrome c peroxidase